MPVNVRRPIDYRMPAANVISLSFIDRAADQLADPMGLLGNLHTETEQTIRLRTSLVFVPALKLLGILPGQLYARIRRPHCQASAALSNLGILLMRSPLLGPDRRAISGGVTLESMEASMPLRDLTHVAFAASIYGRKLSLSISHDPRWIDTVDSRELLESYVQQLKASLAQPERVGVVVCCAEETWSEL